MLPGKIGHELAQPFSYKRLTNQVWGGDRGKFPEDKDGGPALQPQPPGYSIYTCCFGFYRQ